MDYLTDYESKMVVRRARGEYAVHDIVTQIYRAKAKSAPRSCPYMAFLHVVCSRREAKWPEIEPVMRAVLALHPHPSKPVPVVAVEPSEPEAQPLVGSQVRDAIRDALTKPWKTAKS